MTYMDLLAAAYVRGNTAPQTAEKDGGLYELPLEELTGDQIAELIARGKKLGLKMYRFKEKEDLPRVKRALSFLMAVRPESLLDVGSGRGAFLFPFMRDFPETEVTSLDILPHRVEFLQSVHNGGAEKLTAVEADICTWDAPDGSFDVVTMLEVLEHIPDVEKAVKNAVRLARDYVAVSVPSKPDNNPEHIHLLTKDRLTEMFTAAGAKRLSFYGVNGHLLMNAKV